MAQSGAPTEYVAFVSYRHAEVDSTVARDVQHGLERFHVPKAIRRAGGPKRLAPVFRDKEELTVSSALGDDIAYALEHAGALVVVCSPRTKESSWVEREIDAFLRTHDRSRVFTVLAEGEPREVIPRRLLCDEVGGTRVELEPLSCDFRGASRKQRRTELTRLAAAILDVSFDSLVQRARRRTLRIVAAIATAAFVAVSSVAAFALWSNARIKESYDQSVARRAQLLATEAERALDEGDRLEAIELAAAAMPGADEDRPVTPQLTNLLCEATCAYEIPVSGRYSSDMRLIAKYELGGKPAHVHVSPNKRYVASVSTAGQIRVWDLQTSELMFQTRIKGVWDGSTEAVLTDEGTLIAVDEEGLLHSHITAWNITSQEQLWACEVESDLNILLRSDDGAHVFALGEESAYNIDVASGKVACEVSLPSRISDHLFSGDGICSEFGDIRSFDVMNNTCCVALRFKVDYDSFYEQLCVVDFASKSVRMLASRYEDQTVYSVRFVGDDRLVVTHSKDSNISKRPRTQGDAIFQYDYVRAVDLIDLSHDKVLWQAQVRLWAPAASEDFFATNALAGSFVPKDREQEALVYCVGNVCEVLDMGSGKSLARYEAPNPYVVAWPYIYEGKMNAVCGCLSEGRSVATFFTRGNCSSYPNQCKDALWGTRLDDRTLLATEDGMLYCYADALGDDTRVLATTVTHPYSLCTSMGVVFFDSTEHADSKEDDIREGWHIQLLDGSSGKVAWEQTVFAMEDTSLLTLLGYCEDAGELYVSLGEKDGVHTIATVRLKNGEVETWEAHSGVGSSWDKESPFVSRSADGAVQLNDVSSGKLIVTDLSTRSSREVPIPEHYEAHWLFKGEGLISPDQKTIIVRDVDGSSDSSESNGAEKYAMLRPDNNVVVDLKTPVTDLTKASWSSDSSMCALAGDDVLVAYDAKGDELLNAPLEGIKVMSLHFEGDKLLAACNEQSATVLLGYALDGSGEVQRVLLRGKESTAFSTVHYLLEDFQWMPVDKEHDDRNPGDLCICVPDNSLEKNVFLVDVDSLGLCQTVRGGFGYDGVADSFVVGSHDSLEDYYCLSFSVFKRYTADELLERGLEQVGNSRMTDAKRHEYGIDE